MHTRIHIHNYFKTKQDQMYKKVGREMYQNAYSGFSVIGL